MLIDQVKVMVPESHFNRNQHSHCRTNRCFGSYGWHGPYDFGDCSQPLLGVPFPRYNLSTLCADRRSLIVPWQRLNAGSTMNHVVGEETCGRLQRLL